MNPPRDPGPAAQPQRATAPNARRPGAAPSPAGEQPFGPDAATILATEHWSLLGFRSLIWNEAMSRATVFLSVLSAAIITLALLSGAAGGPHTTTLALVLLPVVLFLGCATPTSRSRPAWSPISPPATMMTHPAWRPASCSPETPAA